MNKKKLQYRLKTTVLKAISVSGRKKIMKKESVSCQCSSPQIELETEILLLAHALEKGMGIRNIKVGYGKEKARRLAEKLLLFQEYGYEERYAFGEGAAVLKNYLSFSGKTNPEGGLEQVCGMAERLIPVNGQERYHSGFGIWDSVEKELDSTKNMWEEFQKIVETRHSIRYLKGTPGEKDMSEAISLAMQAPSACNRQPCKVYYTKDPGKAEQVKKLVPGNRGFEDDIPNYLIITCERKLFGPEECFQNYTNGGIFAAFLLLALHAKGIEGCMFQWPAFSEGEQTLKELAGIAESESIIALIGYGYPDESSKYIFAQRRPLEEVRILF